MQLPRADDPTQLVEAFNKAMELIEDELTRLDQEKYRYTN